MLCWRTETGERCGETYGSVLVDWRKEPWLLAEREESIFPCSPQD